MPDGDRSGPMGKGSMTGGGRGNCVEPRENKFIGDRLFCRGRGRGNENFSKRGYRNRYWVTDSPSGIKDKEAESNINDLKRQSGYLNQKLETIQKSIAAIEKNTND